MNLDIIALVVWVLNLEVNSTLGNIWWRIGADGKKHVNACGLLELFKAPWYTFKLWDIRFWDVNPYIFFVLYVLVKAVILNISKDNIPLKS